MPDAEKVGIDPCLYVARRALSEVVPRQCLSFVIVAGESYTRIIASTQNCDPANRIPNMWPTKVHEISSGRYPDTRHSRSYLGLRSDISNETKLFWKPAGRRREKGKKKKLHESKLAGIICNSACKDISLKADICFNS